MANNKVYSRAEMQEAGIVTCDYVFMDKPGEYIGTLEMKAEARGGMLRLFLRLVDGRKDHNAGVLVAGVFRLLRNGQRHKAKACLRTEQQRQYLFKTNRKTLGGNKNV